MELLVFTLFIWFLGLFFLRPMPSDLKEKIPSRLESFKKIQTTFWLGVFFCTIFYFFSNGNFDELDDTWFLIFGINNIELFSPWWFFQALTNNFIHINFVHLFSNLSLLAILSLYERNVGAKRFLTVFLLSGIFSSVSVFFISEDIISSGASGGLLGIGTAYFLDNPTLKSKDYIIGVALVIFIYFFVFQESEQASENFRIDEIGHILGIICGGIYCKLFPRNHN